MAMNWSCQVGLAPPPHAGWQAVISWLQGSGMTARESITTR